MIQYDMTEKRGLKSWV